MTAKSKMSLRPPKTASEDKLRQFIEEPDEKFKTDPGLEETVESAPAPKKRTAKKPKAQEREAYPWEEPGIIPEIVKAFTVRIKLPDKVKADYIVANSLEYKSLQTFFMEGIAQLIDKELKKLGIDQ